MTSQHGQHDPAPGRARRHKSLLSARRRSDISQQAARCCQRPHVVPTHSPRRSKEMRELLETSLEAVLVRSSVTPKSYCCYASSVC